MEPSKQPSVKPTMQPSSQPTGVPSLQPAMYPTAAPTNQPSSEPTSPTSQPSSAPSDYVNETLTIKVEMEVSVVINDMTLEIFNDTDTKNAFKHSLLVESGALQNEDVDRATVTIQDIKETNRTTARRQLGAIVTVTGITVSSEVLLEYANADVNSTTTTNLFSGTLAESIASGTLDIRLRVFSPNFANTTTGDLIVSKPTVYLPDNLRTEAPTGTPKAEDVEHLSTMAIALILLGGMVLLFPMCMVMGKYYGAKKRINPSGSYSPSRTGSPPHSPKKSPKKRNAHDQLDESVDAPVRVKGERLFSKSHDRDDPNSTSLMEGGMDLESIVSENPSEQRIESWETL